MSKTKVKFKITGLEFEFEGERESLPAAASGMAQQLAGMLDSTVVVDGQQPKSKLIDSTIVDAQKPKPRARRSRGKSTSTNAGTDTKKGAIDFKHDPSKYANPNQDWSAADKALWLLLCLDEEHGVKEASAGDIAATFNKHFRTAGPIRGSNISRDLNKLKLKSPCRVTSDTTKDPAVWYLTDEGKSYARSLIAAKLDGVDSMFDT